MDANDLLMGGGVKSAAFKSPGTVVGGPILREPRVTQQTDFDTQKPKFYDDGNPMMQIVVQVQTDQRDDTDDDGVRAFYIKGQLRQAVADAVRAVKAKGLEIGGILLVKYDHDEPNSRGRGNDKKVYAAKYTAPAGQAANDALMGDVPTETPARRGGSTEGLPMNTPPPGGRSRTSFDDTPPF